jgi:hypothetical protein
MPPPITGGGLESDASLHEGTMGTSYSEQSELAQAATPPHARSRSDSIYVPPDQGLGLNAYITKARKVHTT